MKKMLDKKGFTLIELLAVIIILAILMIIAVPNILTTLSTARQQAFRTQAQSIYKAAEQQFTIMSMQNKYITCFSDTPSGTDAADHKLDLGSISATVKYKVVVDSVKGQVTYIRVTDTGQGFAIESGSLESGASAITQNSLSSATISTGVVAGSEAITQCGA